MYTLFDFGGLVVINSISKGSSAFLSSSDDVADIGCVIDRCCLWLAHGFCDCACLSRSGCFGLSRIRRHSEKGLGLLYMAGPTGGYLLGFALAAATTGWLAERGLDRSAIGTAFAMAAGNVVIYVWSSLVIELRRYGKGSRLWDGAILVR